MDDRDIRTGSHLELHGTLEMFGQVVWRPWRAFGLFVGRWTEAGSTPGQAYDLNATL